MRRARAKVDPELRKQLDAAAAAERRRSRPVEAVLRMRPVRRSSRVPEAAAARLRASELLERVAGELGVGASGYDFNVLPNLGFCVLRAPAHFVERVLRQPEVASASANRRG